MIYPRNFSANLSTAVKISQLFATLNGLDKLRTLHVILGTADQVARWQVPRLSVASFASLAESMLSLYH
jgi:hypothetical protein